MYPNLKLHLWKTGMHQNRLARALGLDEALLSKIVNGFRTPSPKLRREMAAYLNCDEGWLFEPSGQYDSPPSAPPDTVPR